MKRIAFCMLAITLYSCTSNNEGKIKESISEHIKQNANDPKSYEAGVFEIDSVYGNPPASYIASMDSLDKLYFNSKIDSVEYKKGQERFSHLVGQPKGYEVRHAYRAKNKLGALIATQNTFVLDSAFKVVDVKD